MFESSSASDAGRALRGLQVVNKPLASLRPSPTNPRTHSPKQIRQIADSIRTFGFTNPILLDSRDRIIAGHGRVKAAKLLGIEVVPTIRIDDLSPVQIRAYAIADNKLAENAGWDRELLAIELHYLADLDLDMDLTVIGFETAEIDILIGEGKADAATDDAEVVPDVDPSIPPSSRIGDLWLLGKHRLLCADALDADAYPTLLAGKRAQLVFIDPPYNVPIDGHVCGQGRTHHDPFVMASGELSEREFVAFLQAAFGHLVRHSIDGSIHYVCMDWRHLHEALTAARATYAELKNLCVWNKTNGGMGSFYRSKHEMIIVLKNGVAAHINNIELGRFGRSRTNVWDYPGVNTFREGRLEELAMHPTVKPVALVADAILDCSKRGRLVLDIFAGSGTTLLAAERTGRLACAMELDPRYVDVAIERFQRETGIDAIHAETRASFADVREERRSVGSCVTEASEGRQGGRTEAVDAR